MARWIPVARVARMNDLAGWLELADEVRPLFGPMPGFEDFARRAIEREAAWVVDAQDGRLGGAVLLSSRPAVQAIRWLAVSAAVRRKGAGQALLGAALARWPAGDIEVVTFGPDVDGGEAARRFYARAGFILEGAAFNDEHGASRERWLLRRGA